MRDAAEHRHVSDSTMYVLSGRGWTEFRDAPDVAPRRVEWAAGDVVAVPADVAHRHIDADADNPSHTLVFDDRPLLRRVFDGTGRSHAGSHGFVADRDDVTPWVVRASGEEMSRPTVFRDLEHVPVEEAPALGRRVSMTRLQPDDGHQTLSVGIIELGHRGHVRRHRHLVEECIFVLAGRGRTTVGAGDGREVTFRWRAGDLISPPLGCWHQHVSEAKSHLMTRLLVVRNRAIEVAVAADEGLSTVLPERTPGIIEPPRSKSSPV